MAYVQRAMRFGLARVLRGRLAVPHACVAPRMRAAVPAVRALHVAPPAPPMLSALPPTLDAVLQRALTLLETHGQELHEPVCACAWVATARRQKTRTFLELTDGTLGGGATLQAVYVGEARDVVPGAAVRLHGHMRAGRGRKAGQRVELQVDSYEVLAPSDPATYPLANLMHRTADADAAAAATEVVRHAPHWKARTAHHGAVARTRSRVESALAAYFDANDFVKVQSPVITASDCEGGGEIFRIVADADVAPHGATPPEQLSAFWSGNGAYLTVSTQLHLEAFALGLSRVWGLCPVFRAEGSSTNRHLAEFWMCEAELCWVPPSPAGLGVVMDCVEGVLKHALRAALGAGSTGDEVAARHALRAQEDMRLLEVDEALLRAADAPWLRIPYTEAVRRLRAHHAAAPGAFAHEPIWGESLRSEHERWLADTAGVPVFVTDYPSSQKPFYMRENDKRTVLTEADHPARVGAEEPTVACFDMLVPRVGELVGGSLREEREPVLAARMHALGLPVGADAGPGRPSLAWYTQDLRRYGGAPHGGFGIGVERLLSWITHTENVRDIVGFPRVKGPLRY